MNQAAYVTQQATKLEFRPTVFEPEPPSAAAFEMAEDILFADVEQFTELLADDCANASSVSSDHETRLPGRLEAAEVATVVHAMLTAARRGDDATCADAVRILCARHAKAFAARIAEIAEGL